MPEDSKSSGGNAQGQVPRNVVEQAAAAAAGNAQRDTRNR